MLLIGLKIWASLLASGTAYMAVRARPYPWDALNAGLVLRVAALGLVITMVWL